jgi:hypothetical protein
VFYNGYREITKDTGVISVAFAFGAAYADYFHEPFLYSLLVNPYSISQVNGVPFDEKIFKDYIPLMERYIHFVSCNKAKIPFLLKFTNIPLLSDKRMFGYTHFPIPEKYYTLPDTCVEKKINEFPLNFFPPFFYAESEK